MIIRFNVNHVKISTTLKTKPVSKIAVLVQMELQLPMLPATTIIPFNVNPVNVVLTTLKAKLVLKISVFAPTVLRLLTVVVTLMEVINAPLALEIII